MNRRLSLLGLTISVVGCASAAQPGTGGRELQAETRVELGHSTALEVLGITERVVVERAGSQRLVEGAITGISHELATCLHTSLDRDPELIGSITYSIRFGAGTGNADWVGKQGDLASLPSAECARKVLQLISIPAPDTEVHAFYSLTFTGSHRPEALPAPETAYRVATWTVEDDDAETDMPEGFGRPVQDQKEAFYRCLVGSEPKRRTPVWVVTSINTDGTVLLDSGGAKDDEADLCIRRKLAGTRFPKHSRPAFLAALFHTPAPQRQPVEPAAVDQANANGPGNMQGDEVGEAFGAGGLGLSGIGEGGGGRGDATGIGSIGTLGHGTGPGKGQGFGNGSGRLGGSHRTKPPKVKIGTATVGPKYPPEVVQRIVRQNFAKFRLCYETGLRKDPNLEGRVEVSFVISRNGSVSSASGAGDLPDKSVISCVSAAFTKLKFPEPEGGVIKVKYPIMFTNDGEGGTPAASAKAAAKGTTAPPKIDGKPLREVTTESLAARLRSLGYEARMVPAAEGTPVPPIVFFSKGDGDVGHVRLGKAGSNPFGDCRRTDGGIALVVTSGGCASVTDRLFD